jgi:uncharacterized RDD family membrane protein YckC
MHCRYCRAWNNDEEHRCVRCGRRLHLANARPSPDYLPVQTATAPELIEVARAASDVPERVVEPQPARIVYQRSLFREMNSVMQIPSLATTEIREPRTSRSSRPRPRRVRVDQQPLEFAPARVRTSLEAVIYCDAPVASPAHRFMAAAIDASLILISLGLFLLTFQVGGGEVLLSAGTLPLFAGVTAILFLFYHALFAIANGDTPGMIWAQLRVVNFDGERPGRTQRAWRFGMSCVSVLSAGLGVLWALVDEENLAWHDHISRTFPSPYLDRDSED